MKKNHFQNAETTWWAILVIAFSLLIALLDFDMDSWVFGLQSGFMLMAGALLIYATIAARRISRIGHLVVVDVEQAYPDDRKGLWFTGIGITAVSALMVFMLYQLPVKSMSATASSFLLAGIIDTALFSLTTSLAWKWLFRSVRNDQREKPCD